MSSIPQMAEAMERVLTTRAKELERGTGFVQRSTAQLDGPPFVQTTVFGWIDNAEASYAQLRHGGERLGVGARPRAVEQPFRAQRGALLRGDLQAAGGRGVSTVGGSHGV